MGTAKGRGIAGLRQETVVALSMLSVGPATADWISVSKPGSGADNLVGYVDPAGIAREGDVAKMSDFRDYRQAQNLKAEDMAYLCSNRFAPTKTARAGRCAGSS